MQDEADLGLSKKISEVVRLICRGAHNDAEAAVNTAASLDLVSHLERFSVPLMEGCESHEVDDSSGWSR